MGKQICPFMSAGGRKVKCIEHDCMMWTQVMGTHPQTGEQLNQSGCAFPFMVTFLGGVIQTARSGVAATESFRNEMVKMGGQPIKLLLPVPPRREVKEVADDTA